MSIRPATHFISLNFAPWYTGHDITVRANKFFKSLSRRVGVKLVYQWRYDGQAVGAWPHIHCLVISPVDIPLADVKAAWVETWPDEVVMDTDAHVRPCDDDIAEAARYYTCHGEPIRQTPKTVWAGPLSGGMKSFFVVPKKTLWTEDYYREGYDGRTVAHNDALVDEVIPLVTDADTSNEVSAGEDGAEPDSSLLYFVTPSHPRSTVNRLESDLGRCPHIDSRERLAHELLPIPPPRVSVGGVESGKYNKELSRRVGLTRPHATHAY